jgi:hypothetical protein
MRDCPTALLPRKLIRQLSKPGEARPHGLKVLANTQIATCFIEQLVGLGQDVILQLIDAHVSPHWMLALGVGGALV